MMAPESRWSRVAGLFDRALECPSSERSAWLAQACPDDAGLRDEVQRMLDAHEAPGGILDLPSPAGSEPADVSDLSDRVRDLLADRYVIERELGRGGTATVFLAQERKHSRPVVLKVLNPEIAALWSTDRFEREVQIAARLGHPHIVGLIDSGEVDGLLYYVMPFIEGETLQARLKAGGDLSLGDALIFLRDIADALAYAHRMGVVHRDLKPGNVWCANRHAFLLDFGIAKMLRPSPGQGHLTGLGAAVGTPAYMAPEQRQADPNIDHRADIYSWGLLAYEMLLGELPDNEALGGIPAKTLLTRRPELMPEIADLVSRCLEPDPDNRLDDAEIMLQALDDMVGSSSISVRRPRRRVAAMVMGGLLAVAAVVAALLLGRGSPGGVDSTALGEPLAVMALVNETGDPTMDTWGRLAGDWLTQGLQEAGIVTVVPWPNALQASDAIRTRQAAGEVVDPIQTVHQETGAAAVITGSYYLVADQIEFRIQITDAEDGTLIGAPPTVSAPRDSVHTAIRTLRDRVMGAVAILRDTRLEPLTDLARRPPLFESYLAFDRGIERFNDQDYGAAIDEFREAYARDTTFAVALLYAAVAHWNMNEYQAVDSMLIIVRQHTNDLSPYHRHRADFLEAYLEGDSQRTLESIRLAADLAPGSDAAYRLADVATKMGRPEEAVAALETLDPDRGAMRGWSAYWLVLTHARHMMGDHQRELEAARAMRERYPDRRVGVALAARALAAMGELARLDSVIEDARSLPQTTYWSRGAAMVVAGEELQAHGWAREGSAMLERAVRWLQTQLELHPGERRLRYWLGTAYYDLTQWEDAAAVLKALADQYGRFGDQGMAAVSAARIGDPNAEQRLPAPTLRTTGSLTAFRARIAAIRGNTDQAVALFNEAIHLGVDDLPWLHATAFHDLQALGSAMSSLPRSLQSEGIP